MGRILIVLFVILLLCLLGAFCVRPKAKRISRKNWPCMLVEENRFGAIKLWNTNGVDLVVSEAAGVRRESEPITVGVPLPEGTVDSVARLRLCNADGQAVPCQVTELSRWPDGYGVKWALLDFQTDASASNTVRYTLRNGRCVAPKNPVRTTSRDGAVIVENERFAVSISTNSPGVIHSIRCDGREIVSAANPVQIELMDASNTVFRASKPTKVVVEQSGPMRATVLVQGFFVSDTGGTIFDGRVGYDTRVTVYAGKAYAKVCLTLKNEAWYGYRNEHRPRKWMYMKSLNLEVPYDPAGSPQWTMRLDRTNAVLSARERAVQWFKFPRLSARYMEEPQFTNEVQRFTKVWPSRLKRPMCEFYWTVERGTNAVGFYPKWLTGWCGAGGGRDSRIQMAVRRFSENYPCGFGLETNKVVFEMFPRGGLWPRTEKACESETYQFEGGRHKTAELLICFDPQEEQGSLLGMMNSPLFAKAAGRWYGDTGAVIPMGFDDGGIADKELAEAFSRYDLLQRSKVIAELGDPAGPIGWPAMAGPTLWEKVSICSLQQMAPEVFMGAMNYGDLVWGFGYCSLHYEWPYTMLQHYLRLGDRQFLDVGFDMIRHRYDVNQYHVGPAATEPYLGWMQRYEKGEHGNLERHDNRTKNWELNAGPSHTWNRDLLLHWALTGDPRSFEAAEQNGMAFAKFFESNKNWSKTNCVEMNEFRIPAWGMEAYLGLFEYTGKTQWLVKAEEVFDKTLLAMERKNGSKGHIIKDGRQDAQFVSFIVEPVCRLHHHTGRRDVIEFLDRVLTWQAERYSAGGKEKDGVYYPTRWQQGDWSESVETTEMGASSVYSWLLVDNYAYLHRVLDDAKNMELADKLFREAVFYYGCTEQSVDRTFRTPIGFHLLGTPDGMHAEKMHAWTGRYGQLYMAVRNRR